MPSMHVRRSGRVALTVGASVALAWSVTGASFADDGAPADQSPPFERIVPTEILTWEGTSETSLGSWLSTNPCDVTGDGKPDLVTSDWMWERGPRGGIGTAYVLPNTPSLQTGFIDDPDTGVRRVEGPEGTKLTGFTVECLGDVNGDGKDDIGISDFFKGRLWVVFGDADFSTLTLDYLGDRGFIVQGTNTIRTSNYSRGIGDLTGDGKAEIAVSSLSAKDSDGKKVGAIDIIEGRDDIATVDLDLENATTSLVRIVGPSEDQPIVNPLLLGDVNGDGTPDLAVSGYVASPEGYSEANGSGAHGMVWILDGKKVREASGIIKANDPEILLYEINGPIRGSDRLGVSVAPIGDVNGDGLADILIGADGSSSSRTGGATIVFGSADKSTVYVEPERTDAPVVSTVAPQELSAGTSRSVPESRGYWINGINNSDRAGYAVASTVNDEGVGVVVLGAYNAESPDGNGAAGAVYIVDIDAIRASDGRVDLAELSDSQLHTVYGENPGERLGRSVASIGDWNGDGTGDIAWGGDAVRGGSGVVSIALMPTEPAPEPEPDPAPDGGNDVSPAPDGGNDVSPAPDGGDGPSVDESVKASDSEKSGSQLPVTGVALGLIGGLAIVAGISGAVLAIIRRKVGA